MRGIVESLSRRLDRWGSARLETLVGLGGLLIVVVALGMAAVPLYEAQRTVERLRLERASRLADLMQRNVQRTLDTLEFLLRGALRESRARNPPALDAHSLPTDFTRLFFGTTILAADGGELLEIGRFAPDKALLLREGRQLGAGQRRFLAREDGDLIMLGRLSASADRDALVAFALSRRVLGEQMEERGLLPGMTLRLLQPGGEVVFEWGTAAPRIGSHVARRQALMKPDAIGLGAMRTQGGMLAQRELGEFPVVMQIEFDQRFLDVDDPVVGRSLIGGMLVLAALLASLTLILMAAARSLSRARARGVREATLFEATPDPVILVRDAGAQGLLCERINPAAQRIFRAFDLPANVELKQLTRGDVLCRAVARAADIAPGLGAGRFDLAVPQSIGETVVQLSVLVLQGDDPQQRLYAIVGRDLTAQRQAERVLRERSAQLEAIIDSAMDAVIITDEQRRIIMFNKAAEQMFGYPAGAVLGRDPLFLVPERYRSEHEQRFLVHARRHQGWRLASRERPMYVLRAEGSELPVEVAVSRVDLDERRLFTLILRDMSERLTAEREIHALNESLERRVAERTAELQRAYQEMEAFSYSVSHDLRAPLRAIHGYTYLLIDSESDKLSNEGRNLLEKVMRASVRMGELIDDFLDFSRVGRTELNRQQVDMHRMVAELVADLRAEHPQLAVVLAPLPLAWGDPRLLHQAWHNLLANAVKFSAQQPQARVEIGVRYSEGRCWYYVADNGVGFEMAYADKLFGVFQRLHPARDYEGTGIGLAIVKRILERHHGGVRADGVPGQGATFSFWLP